MHAPPDPDMRRAGFTRNEASPEIAKSEHRELYHLSQDKEALLFAIAPLLAILLIAIGARQ